MTDEQNRNVKYIGNQVKRDASLAQIDAVLKEKGRFDDGTDLTAGLGALADDYQILISDDDDSFAVKMEPLVPGKQELNITVFKVNGTIYRSIDDSVSKKTVDDDQIDFLDEI
ncbi:hypothetical protein JCM14469_32470 [Desulfatiferula olefinivorans]